MDGIRAAAASQVLLNPEKLPDDDLAFLAGGVAHEPVGHTGQGLWHRKGVQLPAYIQHIANDLISERGMPESRAIATAVSRCKVWCATSKDAAVKAKACAAVAEWETLKVKSTWNPALHPRVPAGQTGGGEFGPGGAGKPAPTTNAPVQNGASGQQVANLQTRLNELGFHLKVDGKFGPKTMAAVRQFQSQHVDAHGKPLKVDGQVGPLTTSALRMKHPRKVKHHRARIHKVHKHRHKTLRHRRRHARHKHLRHRHHKTVHHHKRPLVKKHHHRVQRVLIRKQGGKIGVTTVRRHHKPHAAAGMPELVTIPGVDLLAAGTWELSSGRNTFTRDDITNAIDAAKCPAIGNPVIKLGHIDPRFDGQPAIGSVQNMRVDDSGNKLIGDLANMPGWFGAIAHAAFPKRSVEGAYDFKCQIGHTHPFVLTGLAMLGVTAPGVGVLNNLPDIADLYGLNVSAAATLTGWDFDSGELDEGAIVAVTEEDVRRAYYADSSAPSDWWITELQMGPTQLIVSSSDGKIFRVPFTISGDEITFGASAEVASYADLAASRGTGRIITYASAAESRSVVEGANDLGGNEGDNASMNGWTMRGGRWVYDPDNDGDDDSAADTDADHSHWDENNQLKPGVKIPPQPAGAPRAAEYTGPYADPKNKKYKIDNEGHTRAAWAYINMPKNAEKYPMNGVTLGSVKSAITAACKKFGIDVSEKTAASYRLDNLLDLKDALDGVSAAAGEGDGEATRLMASLNAALDRAGEDSSEIEAAESLADQLMDLLDVYDPDEDDTVNAGAPSASASTPPTLDGDQKTGDMNNSSMTHGAYTGTHTHKHAANGSQGSDATHTHSHSHKGSGDHGHAHAATAGAGAKERSSDVEFTAEQEASLRVSLGLNDDEEFSADAVMAAAASLKAMKVVAGKRTPPPGVIQISEEVWADTMKKVEAADRFRAKVLRSERDDLIDGAIREGKFSAASRTQWSRLFDSDPEGTKETLATLKKNVIPVNDIGDGGGSLDDDAYAGEFAALYPADDPIFGKRK